MLVDYPETVKLARHALTARLDFQSLPEALVQLETLSSQSEYVWSNITGLLEKGLALEPYSAAYRELYDSVNSGSGRSCRLGLHSTRFWIKYQGLLPSLIVLNEVS